MIPIPIFNKKAFKRDLQALSTWFYAIPKVYRYPFIAMVQGLIGLLMVDLSKYAQNSTNEYTQVFITVFAVATLGQVIVSLTKLKEK